MKLRTVSVLVAAAALLALSAGPTAAGKLAGVTMPDQVTVAGKTLVLNGLGLREATALNVHVYVAGLYVEEPKADPQAIVRADEVKQLNLAFVLDVDRGNITDAWAEGFKKNVGEDPRLTDRIERLNSWMTDMNVGDTLTFTYIPGTGTLVHLNGEQKGVLEGRDFAQALFSIWLGPEPPNSGLKKGLLGRR